MPYSLDGRSVREDQPCAIRFARSYGADSLEGFRIDDSMGFLKLVVTLERSQPYGTHDGSQEASQCGRLIP